MSISLDTHGVGMLGTAKLTLSTMSNFLRPAMLGGTKRKFKLIVMHWSEEDMKALTGLMAEGKLKVPIDEKYPSDQQGVMAAYEKIMSNKVSFSFRLWMRCG